MSEGRSVGDLARHYSRFRVGERVLLTGHSHQAWPDVAFEAQQRAWLDAAELVDDKWERAAQIAEDVRDGWRTLLNDPQGTIALGQNTHELVVRLLSAVLPMFGLSHGAAEAAPSEIAAITGPTSLTRPTCPTSPKLITTDGEFHTIRRQLDRLAEAGIEVIKIPARPVETLAERMAAAVDDRTACVLLSSVLFETAEIVPHLSAVADACTRCGATLLVDAYHHLNVVPFDLHALGLSSAFIVGGGYKYCQLGEGNCFLRVPQDCELHPVITGWFSEFAELAERQGGDVRYGAGAARWAGATYDPTSHYRAAAVFAFHRAQDLSAARLRAINQRQIALLQTALEQLDLDPALGAVVPMPVERRGGFLAVRTPGAATLVRALRERGVWTDARGEFLRLGPAPYLSDEQLETAAGHLGEALRTRVNPRL
jgi:kynureninase